MEKDYEYPYGDMQVHEALEDLDRRLKALEPKAAKSEPVKKSDAVNPVSTLPGHGISTGPTTGSATDKSAV